MTMITGSEKIQRFTVVALRGHLKLMKAGLRNSQISGTQMLAKAGAVTGKVYKRGQYDAAIADINTWLEANA
jgi:hypothetical protein